MIHIATIHWNTDRWIAPQHAFLRKHVKGDFRVYAWLNNIPQAATDSFYYSCSEPITPHAVKLNILADIIHASSSHPDDILIFMDGDAFPIADMETMVRQTLQHRKLMAIQRLENNGDSQPHPCFCATTVGFWRQIKGDWKEGYRWKNKYGEDVTDVGANLMKQLIDHRVDWAPLLRSNKVNLHPLYFGIYGGVIYHHGAGFRESACRLDGDLVQYTAGEMMLSKVVPGYRKLARKKALQKIVARNGVLSEEIFAKILRDPEFYRQFM